MPEDSSTATEEQVANQQVDSTTTQTSPDGGDASSEEMTIPKARWNEVYGRFKNAERENERLKAENAQLSQQAPVAPTQTQEPTISLEALDYDQEEYDKAIQAQMIDKKVQQGIDKGLQKIQAKMDQEKAQQQQQQLNQKFTERSAQYAAQNPEYDKAIAENKDVQFPQVVAQAIVESQMGPQVEHYLYNDASERARIGALPPLQQAVEIGKLESKLAASPNIQKTKAPPPIEQINTGSGKPISPYSSGSMDDYRKSRGW